VGAGLFFVALGAAIPARADEGGKATASGIEKQAAIHYKEGLRAAKRGQWERAHEAFLAAWRIQAHPRVAAELGRTEIELGMHLEAAEHLAFSLREGADATPAEREEADTLWREARSHVGILRVRVEGKGANVLVDGRSVGYAPLERSIFVEPGQRVIEAHGPGSLRVTRMLKVKAGAAADVHLVPAPPRAPVALPAPAPPAEPDPDIGTIQSGVAATALISVFGFGTGAAALAKREQSETRRNDACRSCPGGYNDMQRDAAFLGNVAIWSFITAGAIGVATTIYASSVESDKAAVRTTARVAPGFLGVEMTF
jgi:hypothetical protein